MIPQPGKEAIPSLCDPPALPEGLPSKREKGLNATEQAINERSEKDCPALPVECDGNCINSRVGDEEASYHCHYSQEKEQL